MTNWINATVFTPTASCLRPGDKARLSAPVFKLLVGLTIWLCVQHPGVLAQTDHDNGKVNTHPLRVGLLPHLSSNMLIKKYQPLIEYLRKNLQRPVIVNTAPSFRAYIDRAADNRYDIYLTAPHFAAFHERQNDHQVLTRFSRELHGVFVVRKDSRFKAIRDLKGTTVVTPSPIAAISMLGEVKLMDNGLGINREVLIKYTKSHTSALVSVADAKADVAIVGVSAYELMPKKTKKTLRILSKTDTIPHMFFLSSPNVLNSEQEKIKAALLSFADDEMGGLFFSDAAFGDIIPATEQDIVRMDPMIPLLKKRLAK
jgi:phosphonate transport system substrate-binding protein